MRPNDLRPWHEEPHLERSSRYRTSRGAAGLALAIVLALVCTACSDSESPFRATFEPGPCPAAHAAALAELNASCGTLIVPAKRNPRSERKFRLPVAIVPSITQPALPDPIFHLTGGPGGDALSEAPSLVQFGLNQKRDLIVMDQRGDSDTEPSLTCVDLDIFYEQVIGLPYAAPATQALHLAATKACHNAFVAKGIDLSDFNTAENASDFADLRNALNIREWNLYGFSYGTNLALSILRDHPEGIRSVIIDSVAPPSVATPAWIWTNVNEGINNIFRACAAQPLCASEYGDLAGTFELLVRKYEANPLTTTVVNPDGETVTVVIDGGHLVNWLAAIPQPAIPLTPTNGIAAAIKALADGDPGPIARSRAFFTSKAGRGSFGHGLAFSVFCSEWVPFSSESQILTQGLLAFPAYPVSVLSQAPQLAFIHQDCVIWNVPAAPPSVRQATISDVPTLVITGSYDGRTSPQWGAFAASNLRNSTNIVIPAAGHWATAQSTCAQSVIASFLATPLSPDTTCVSKLTPPPFSSPGTTAAPGGI